MYSVAGPGWQLKQIITGARPKISQRHRLCTHNRTYNPDYVSNNLDLRVSKEKRERGPLREVGKRVRVRAYRPKLSRLSSDFCR